jgi:large subunit ribosomal protein L17
MLRNLVTSLLQHERVTTTDAKAKEVRPLAERIITYGKRGDLHSRRKALSIVRSRAVVSSVFDAMAKRFSDRRGGYTRIIKLGRRRGDGAPLSIIEILPEKAAEKPASRAKAKGKKAPVKAKPKAKGEAKTAGRKKAAPKKDAKKKEKPKGG